MKIVLENEHQFKISQNKRSLIRFSISGRGGSDTGVYVSAFASLPRFSHTKTRGDALCTQSRSGPPVIGGDKTRADIRKIRSSLRKKNLFLCALASKHLDGKRIDIEFQLFRSYFKIRRAYLSHWNGTIQFLTFRSPSFFTNKRGNSLKLFHTWRQRRKCLLLPQTGKKMGRSLRQAFGCLSAAQTALSLDLLKEERLDQLPQPQQGIQASTEG